ncbi:hypothetical protein KY290_003701 [Solanum tuberosum]|uniref:Leucine-rich repeat-containing N-terminal plant-type domain-containing protein n=1 Tax=Solanum tuberosum TaxID=4113 RepID=A0ABQ7WTM3_SOLTU|nr:hypothetical protein KY290_003701 [Solanum tuberosum]
MFTIDAFDRCFDITGQPLYPKTLSWNKSTDCCSWEGVYCDETTGKVIELNLACSKLQGKFHSNSRVFQLSNLKRLDLSNNNFSGSYISPKFGEFSSLTQLDLSYSGFTGIIPAQISRLSKLQVLRIQSYSDGLRFKPHNFELLLKNLTQLRELDFDNVNISSTIPLNFSSYLTTLHLRNTQFYGVLPERVFHLSNLESLELSFNPQLTVRFPTTKWNSSASLQMLDLYSVNATEELYLGYNHLEGPISDFFRFGKLRLLSLANNIFDFKFLPIGNIQEFKSKTLDTASLKQNQLQGPIPKSLLNQRDLYSLVLSHNNLSGQIASTICNLTKLLVLDLGSNNLEGTIPLCLGNNELNDTFPKWLRALPNLKILRLRSNKFFGPIKDSSTYKFAQIRIIDLSSNGFSGNLPVSLFENFEAMKINGEKSGTREYVADMNNVYYANSFIVTTKGLDLELPRVLTTNIIIDLSRNRFEGHIPGIIGDLIRLRTLNLSHNRLEGHIPASLHQLSVLESLDLSSNKISGEIPQQLASLKSLEVLNLSHNHLVGCIPKGKQFDTFENSSYQGNDGLRGFPLSKDCGGDDGVAQTTTPVELDEEGGGDSSMISWQAVLMGYGCGLVIGLSIIYIMLSTQYPAWFSRMDVKLEHKILTRMRRHKKRH